MAYKAETAGCHRGGPDARNRRRRRLGTPAACAERAREEAKIAPPPKAVAGVAAVAGAVPDLAANRALARQQVALVDQAWATLNQMGRNARISIADPSFSVWGRREVETLRKAGAGKAEMVAALEKYISTLKEHEAIANVRREAARGTLVEVYDVQFRQLEAEIWLNEEKAR